MARLFSCLYISKAKAQFSLTITYSWQQGILINLRHFKSPGLLLWLLFGQFGAAINLTLTTFPPHITRSSLFPDGHAHHYLSGYLTTGLVTWRSTYHAMFTLCITSVIMFWVLFKYLKTMCLLVYFLYICKRVTSKPLPDRKAAYTIKKVHFQMILSDQTEVHRCPGETDVFF